MNVNLKAVSLVSFVSLLILSGFLLLRNIGSANAASFAFQVNSGPSTAADISADGRYVVFQSLANDVIDDDTNGVHDIFLHDRDADENDIFDEHDKAGGVSTIRINVDSNGNPAAGGDSTNPAISDDGRFIVYQSRANNLVENDFNGLEDIFVYDLDTGATTRINVDSNGNPAAGGDSAIPAISDDGRFIVYQSNAHNLVENDINGVEDIFVYDRNNGNTTRVNVDSNGNPAAGGHSTNPVISENGQYVAFQSNAHNLLGPNNDTNGVRDIFLHNRDVNDDGVFDESGDIATMRASVKSDGTPAAGGDSTSPAISDDGRYIAYQSRAHNLVENDINGVEDIFVYDRNSGATTRINVDSNGNPAAGFHSSSPAISDDGRYIAYQSGAHNLVENDVNGLKDIFVYDRNTSATNRINVDSNGDPAAGGHSEYPAMSDDGRFVVFQSIANSLVSDDDNGLQDIFTHDRDADEDFDFDEHNQPGAISTARTSVRTINVTSAGDSTLVVASDGSVSGGCFVGTAGNGLLTTQGTLTSFLCILLTIFVCYLRRFLDNIHLRS